MGVARRLGANTSFRWGLPEAVGLPAEPAKRGAIPRRELQYGHGSRRSGHSIALVVAVSPKPKRMAEFVQRCRLKRCGALSGADQHIDAGLQAPVTAMAFHSQQAQQAAAMAGAAPT